MVDAVEGSRQRGLCAIDEDKQMEEELGHEKKSIFNPPHVLTDVISRPGLASKPTFHELHESNILDFNPPLASTAVFTRPMQSLQTAEPSEPDFKPPSDDFPWLGLTTKQSAAFLDDATINFNPSLASTAVFPCRPKPPKTVEDPEVTFNPPCASTAVFARPMQVLETNKLSETNFNLSHAEFPRLGLAYKQPRAFLDDATINFNPPLASTAVFPSHPKTQKTAEDPELRFNPPCASTAVFPKPISVTPPTTGFSDTEIINFNPPCASTCRRYV